MTQNLTSASPKSSSARLHCHSVDRCCTLPLSAAPFPARRESCERDYVAGFELCYTNHQYHDNNVDQLYHIQAALHDLYMPGKILARESLLQKNGLYLQFYLVLLNGIPEIIEVLLSPFWIRLFPITRRFPPKQGDNQTNEICSDNDLGLT